MFDDKSKCVVFPSGNHTWARNKQQVWFCAGCFVLKLR